MANSQIELSLLEDDEREQLDYIWNLLPEQDKENLSKEDILFVLDSTDDFLEEEGLLEVDEKTGEVTYLDGDIDETKQLDYILAAAKDGAKRGLCSPLTSAQVQMILDGEMQFGLAKGWYTEEE